METKCEICGASAWEHAFVFCVYCLESAIHRYCLYELPETYDEFVPWLCEDCRELNYIKRFLCIKFRAQSAKRELIASEDIQPRHQNGPTKRPRESPEELFGSDQIGDAQNVAKIPKFDEGWEGPESNRNPFYQTFHAMWSDFLENGYVRRALPIYTPIWRGSFNIDTEDYDLFNGVKAHVSNIAHQKVADEAELLPESLNLELLPKASVWPKRFNVMGLADDNIGIYFFATNKSYETMYNRLVNDMMSKDLALKAVVTNAELLVFTSTELPHLHWILDGKFYLWGTFTKKQGASPNKRRKIGTMENSGKQDAMSPILSNGSSTL